MGLKIDNIRKQKYFCDSTYKLVRSKVPPESFYVPGYPYTKIFRYTIGSTLVDFEINEIYCRKGMHEPKHGIDLYDSIGNFKTGIIFIVQQIDTIAYDSLSVIDSILSKRIAQIDSVIKGWSIHTAAKWTYLDFCYFSTITQATVGYGDMLPNSKIIRFLVIIQTLTGLLLTVFFITFSYNGFFKNNINSK